MLTRKKVNNSAKYTKGTPNPTGPLSAYGETSTNEFMLPGLFTTVLHYNGIK